MSVPSVLRMYMKLCLNTHHTSDGQMQGDIITKFGNNGQNNKTWEFLNYECI